MAADKPLSNYEDVFEEGEAPKEAQTVHRIRANSTIMQLNKILGELSGVECAELVAFCGRAEISQAPSCSRTEIQPANRG